MPIFRNETGGLRRLAQESHPHYLQTRHRNAERRVGTLNDCFLRRISLCI